MLADISIADALSSCPSLISVDLSRNMIDRAPNYRAVICALIPNLTVLDGTPVDPSIRLKVTNAMILDASAAMKSILEDREDEERLEMNIMEEESLKKPNATTSLPSGGISVSASGREDVRESGASFGVESDTGSELTHGSSVVLAGGMAAAIRKRRAQRSSSAAAKNDPQNISLVEMTSPERSGNESALQILDAAKHAERTGRIGSAAYLSLGDFKHENESDAVLASSLFEGDVTLSVLGHQPRPGTSSGMRPSTSGSPRMGSSHGRQNALQKPPFTTANSNRSLDSGSGDIDDDPFPDKSLQLPAIVDSDGGGRISRDGKPPRSPQIFSTGSPRVGSPRQHNVSRPQTTSGRPSTSASSNSNGGDGGGLSSEVAMAAPSAPFKVSIPLAMRGEDINVLRSRLAPPSSIVSEDDDEDISSSRSSTAASSSRSKPPSLRVSTPKQSIGGQPALLNDYGKSSDQNSQLNESPSGDNFQKNQSAEVTGRAGGSIVGIAALSSNKSKSIVHRDVVKRHGRHTSSSLMTTADNNGDKDNSDDDSDDEDIYVDHSSRHKMMVSKEESPARPNRIGIDLMSQIKKSGRPISSLEEKQRKKVSAYSAPFNLDFEGRVDDDDGSSDLIVARQIPARRPINQNSNASEKPPIAPTSTGPTLSSIVR